MELRNLLSGNSALHAPALAKAAVAGCAMSSARGPVILITVFAKNEKASLTGAVETPRKALDDTCRGKR